MTRHPIFVLSTLLLGMAPCHALDEIRDCDVCPQMVVLPAGQFAMGSPDNESTLPDEKPAHTVRIAKSFAVGKFEVSFLEWDACAAEGSCASIDDESWGRGSHPAINVNHAAAKAYTAWLTRKTGHLYRLLTESEWEYAARGGTTTAWYWGSIEEGLGIPTACLHANTHDQTSRQNQPGYAWVNHPCEDGFTYTAPVGTFRPNAFGLHDMLGNVAEWVEDCHMPYAQAPTDGSAAVSDNCEQRVTRGGAWLHGPAWVRSAFRHPQSVTYANYTVGFRVARDLR